MAGAAALLDALQGRQFIEWKRVGGASVLEQPRRELAQFDIDWATLDRRRRAELAKLDAMQQYAYLKTCRRGFVLRYFGDPAARAHCAGCDNCLGTHVDVSRTSASSRQRSQGKKTLKTSREASASAGDEIALGPADGALLEQLRTLRSKIAKEEQVPAYVVFPDRTLAEMAVRRPRTTTALAGIRGVGPTKLERYGDRFLTILRSADGTEAA